MNNKMLIALLVKLFIISIAHAQGELPYQAGDTLHVWAESGLNVRTKPHINGEKLGTIKYENKIVALGSPESSNLETTIVKFAKTAKSKNRTASTIKIQGNWVKINFDGQVGYVFDGYLSRFPVSKTQNLGRYLKTHFKVLDSLNTHNFRLAFSKVGDSKNKRLIYEGGIVYDEEGGENWAGEQVIFPSLSFREGLLIFKRLFLDYPSNLTTEQAERDLDLSYVYEVEENFIEIVFAMSTVRLQYTYGVLVISASYYC